LKTKNEVLSHFQEFSNFIENHYSAKVKIFRSDNGTEYVNKNFTEFFKQKGILHQTTCINTPEQNGIFERKNRHLLEVTRSLLFQNNIPKIYWSDAVLTATYLINRLPSPRLKNMSPLEILKGRKIDLDHIRVFGCTCFVHIKRHDKLDTNSVKIIFLGYSSEKKGYKCYDPKNHKLYISRDVSFVENEPYFKKGENHLDTQGQPIILFPNSCISPEETYQEQVAHDEAEPFHESGASSSGGENESNEETCSRSNCRAEINTRNSASYQVKGLCIPSGDISNSRFAFLQQYIHGIPSLFKSNN
jgi:hypothetical protein